MNRSVNRKGFLAGILGVLAAPLAAKAVAAEPVKAAAPAVMPPVQGTEGYPSSRFLTACVYIATTFPPYQGPMGTDTRRYRRR